MASTAPGPAPNDERESSSLFDVKPRMLPGDEQEQDPPIRSVGYKILPGSFTLGRITVPTAKLYPFPLVGSDDLKLAQTRLADGIKALDEAIEAIVEGDVVSSDNAVLAFSGVLPDLFLCSSIGDGFAAVVVGANYAVKNNHPEPFTLQQLRDLRYLMILLREQPAMKHDQAIERLMKLEDVGLVVDPPGLGDELDEV